MNKQVVLNYLICQTSIPGIPPPASAMSIEYSAIDQLVSYVHGDSTVTLELGTDLCSAPRTSTFTSETFPFFQRQLFMVQNLSHNSTNTGVEILFFP